MLENPRTGARKAKRARSRGRGGATSGWRLALFGGTALALLATVPSLPWALALCLPIASGAAAAYLFEPRVFERWVRRGHLLLADLGLVGLALLGSPHLPPLVLGALFGVAALALLVRDRTRTWLASLTLLAMAATLAFTLPGLRATVGLVDLLFLPVLVCAAAHFGVLGERVRSRRAVRRGDSVELWTMLEITDSVTSTLDVGEVMRSVVERVGDMVDTRSCTVLLAEGGLPGCFVVASKGHPDADMLRIDLDGYPEVSLALESRQPVVVDDIRTHPIVAGVRDVLDQKGYRSMLVLPLLFGREVLGALFLRSDRPGHFDAEAQRFCRVAAGVAANTLKNALLYRDVKKTGEKLRRILDSTPDMIVATDIEGVVTEFNRGAADVSGIAADQAIGRPLEQIVDQAGAQPTGPEPQEIALTRPDGARVEVSLVSAPLHGAAGEPVGVVWIGRDVTKLRRVERSLVQAERLSSLGEIVAGVAHELNNPLSGVVGYAELLRSNAQDPAQLQDLNRIVESAMRCQKIVLKLLSFARKQPPEKRQQNLNDCVAKVVDLKSYHLRSSEIETVLELDPDLPSTSFDFQQIEQVILNLLNNAEQAVSEVKRSGRIVLRTGQSPNSVWVEVCDDGPGVSREAAERVFDPFFSTKELGKGTGLGLSVSYGIVQEHDGKIELIEPSESEEGACFRVSLPIVETEVVIEIPEKDPAAQDEGVLCGRRVLVAEDEPAVLELFARLLRDEGAEVVQARDGAEAWAEIEESDFDLVIADLRMPNVTGQELYEKVAAERPDLLRRFVFATGDLVREESMAFLRRLPNRILMKPLEIETVRRVLSQALETL